MPPQNTAIEELPGHEQHGDHPARAEDNPPTHEALYAEQLKSRRFLERVARYEQRAARYPEAHRRFIIGMIGLSYAFVAVLLLIAILSFAASIWILIESDGVAFSRIKSLIVFGLFSFVILRSLLVRIPLPAGKSVTREEAPRLWEMVEEVAATLETPIPERILLTFDFNASAAQRPRFGVLGGFRNYLSLGGLVMLGMSESEVRSVIAHEFGHFSRQHGKLGTWVYRTLRKWKSLRSATSYKTLSNLPVRVFGDWWLTRFLAATYATRRQGEFQADSDAVRLAGADAAGAALCRLAIGSTLRNAEDNSWNTVGEREISRRRRQFERDAAVIGSGIDVDRARSALANALRWSSAATESHPSLAERLRTMGIDPQRDFDRLVADAARPRSPSAADFLLGKNANWIAEQVEAEMARQDKSLGRTPSKSETDSIQRTLARQHQLESQLASGQLDAWGKAELLPHWFLAGRHDDALSLASDILRELPQHQNAKVMTGAVLLDRGDPAGLTYLDAIIRDEGPDSANALEEIKQYWRKLGDRGKYDATHQRQRDFRAAYAKLAREFEDPDCIERLSAANASEGDRKAMQKAAAAIWEVGRVYVASAPSFGNSQRMIIYVFSRFPFFDGAGDRRELVAQFETRMNFSRPALVISPARGIRWRRQLRRIPGALVFDRKIDLPKMRPGGQ